MRDQGSPRVASGEFRRYLADAGAGLIERLAPHLRPPFQRALTLIDSALQEPLLQHRELGLPWRCPEPAREALLRSVAGEPDPADVRRACLTLWHVLQEQGLITGPLEGSAPRRRPDIADLTGPAWSYVPAVIAAQRFLLSGSAFEHRNVPPEADVPIEAEEARLVGNAVLALATSGVAAKSFLTMVVRLRPREDVDWAHGVLSVRWGRGAPQRYWLPAWALLHLGALERFYRTRGRALREAEDCTLLPARWQDPGRLAHLLRRRIREMHSGSGRDQRGWRLTDFLAASRLTLALDLPPALVELRAGRLLVAPADADLRPLGIPMRGSALSKNHTEPLHPMGPVECSKASAPELIDAVQAALHGLRHGLSIDDLRRRADALRAALVQAPPASSSNTRFFAAYAAHVLSTARAAATAANLLHGFLTPLEIVTEGIPLSDLSVDELQDCCVELVQLYFDPGSMRAMRRRLQAFLVFLHKCGDLPAQPRWDDPALKASNEVTWQPLLLPAEIEALVEGAVRAGERALAAATVLGTFCGPRRTELTMLDVPDVLSGPLGEVTIRKSKSAAGIRTLPSFLLAPPSARRVVEDYHSWRVAQGTAGSPKWLLAKEGRPYTPDSLGRAFSALTQRILGRSLGLHTLRRTAGSWLLVRFLVATGCWQPVTDRSSLGEELMGPAALAGVRQLFDRLAATRNPEGAALWIVAGVLGHASPLVSVNYYLGALEWLQFRIADPSRNRLLGIKYAKRILGVSVRQVERKVPRASRPRGQVRVSDWVRLLAERLG